MHFKIKPPDNPKPTKSNDSTSRMAGIYGLPKIYEVLQLLPSNLFDSEKQTADPDL